MTPVQPTARFTRKFIKLTKNNQQLHRQVVKFFKLLQTDPFSASIKTHKVIIGGVNFWSSRVNGDLRLIWQFASKSQNKFIVLINLGPHSGSKKVYK
jgi:mRNA-degrading endonuclease YafQ of YafQ-DinJ toxin-antitoxin module